MPEVSPSVLVIRLDAIGDALALTPALASLRRDAIPFDMVLTDRNAGVFAHAAARRTFVADFALRASTPQNRVAIDRLGARLRTNGYTHVVVATEDPGGYRLASAIGAPERIGFADPWTKPFKALWTRRLLTHAIYRSARLQGHEHECQTLFRLFAPIIADTEPSRDSRELRALVLDLQPAKDDRTALQLTDKWARLGIPAEDIATLAGNLRSAGPTRLIAARAEAAYAQAIAQRAGAVVEYFDDLNAWKTAVAAARVLIAPDSGAIHLAGMVGTPVVAVFPPQPRFQAQIARWSPWASSYTIVLAERDWPMHAAAAAAALRL